MKAFLVIIGIVYTLLMVSNILEKNIELALAWACALSVTISFIWHIVKQEVRKKNSLTKGYRVN